ncbi:hypothetical protein [Luteibaculum oceani]|uniref:Glycosyl transferase family 28 C-terminal domain-containing protein n=1 Tax=Luteibaculum oceani TaxID=1294296 RepID=A0A5C6UZR5_9FLAO|nr:hypothetical protein [Luteibaculum oceani]TXC78923.1 hypothetical protein FRX97_06830 [Luteibaculum oceani]
MEKRLMYGVLNWGLGHATRSVPVIDFFLSMGWKVEIASDGKALSYLNDAYPQLTFHTLNSYRIKYLKKPFLTAGVALSGIRIKKVIKWENWWLKEHCLNQKYDLIISDARLGFYHSAIPSVLINHQINPAPFGWSRWLKKLRIHYFDKFTELWIPDFENQFLSGKLSAISPALSSKTRFIGLLSQYQSRNAKIDTIEIVAVASGPEIEARRFTQRVFKLLSNSKYERWIILCPYSVEEINDNRLLIGERINQVCDYVLAAERIISYSGYTTLMDAALLQKPLLCFPTPGQPEQEYLAKKHGFHKGFPKGIEEEQFMELAAFGSARFQDQITSFLKANRLA